MEPDQMSASDSTHHRNLEEAVITASWDENFFVGISVN